MHVFIFHRVQRKGKKIQRPEGLVAYQRPSGSLQKGISHTFIRQCGQEKCCCGFFEWKRSVNKVFQGCCYSYPIHPSLAFASVIMDKHNATHISATIANNSPNFKKNFLKNHQIIALPLCSKVLGGGKKRLLSLRCPLCVSSLRASSLPPPDSVIIERDGALWGGAFNNRRCRLTSLKDTAASHVSLGTGLTAATPPPPPPLLWLNTPRESVLPMLTCSDAPVMSCRSKGRA